MPHKVDEKLTDERFMVILTVFDTTGDWAAFDEASTLPGLHSASLQVVSSGDSVEMQIETIVMPSTYDGIATKVAELHGDDTWDCMIHVAPADDLKGGVRVARGAERMGYDGCDAEGQFAPMINPLRGTRGLEGKGRKWHTTADVEGLVRHLKELKGYQALSSCDNPGLGASGFLHASSLKAASGRVGGPRSVLCFLTPSADKGETAASASQTKQLLLDACQWFAPGRNAKEA